MARGQQKREREAAARAEYERRRQLAVSACPLTHAQLLELSASLARAIDTNGHDDSFSLVEAWCRQVPIEGQQVIDFFKDQGLTCDWDVAISGLAAKLFGPLGSNFGAVPLSRDELEQLVEFVDERLQAQGCAHDQALVREWCRENDHEEALVIFGLATFGGFCDCEVVLNVELNE